LADSRRDDPHPGFAGQQLPDPPLRHAAAADDDSQPAGKVQEDRVIRFHGSLFNRLARTWLRCSLADSAGDVEFLEPWALAMFSAYVLWMKHEGSSVTLVLDPRNPCNVYMEQMGIREILETGNSVSNWDESRANTGLHVIHSHQDALRFRRSARLLGGGPDESAMDALGYGMSELSRNVVQHAASPIGGVAIAQYFPEDHRIQVAICDRGIGVRDALSSRYPEISSNMEALKLALLPHVSGAIPEGPCASSENAGLGLFFSKEICWRSEGGFWIASQDALVGVSRDDASARDRVYRRINAWPGTLVVMDLPARGVDDFAGLLQVCNALAASARSASGPSGLEFVQSSYRQIDF
jgi:hypothetical protein